MGNVVIAMVCGGAHCLEIYLLEMFYCLVHEKIETEPISNIAISRTHEAVDLSRSGSAHQAAPHKLPPVDQIKQKWNDEALFN